ncbi:MULTISPECIES: DUF680 domain-containing protein [Mesorhizobium]|uniref:DUF680 domain-containing protein n=2 Tax=Mesorhizobium TaxID=68287 RepID=A0A1A5J5X3_RHILI|nr:MULTISPECIES: DUF680 domain-containing protein [Mesorhizobium]ETA72285.1 Protein of unknown function (DUF680) [Mesorhizobium japonicum R7A]MBE1709618.1 DUF680 domain-containing protein [Mesorhizobium japonicum]MBE1714287.1 DUF680 domain-containing protein [Mesorhizobium japonicum]MUT25021.1 DUF680 domain-containing protein [Mesorhizobium japonicum]MUT28678.1 DUF680 domain-containing protein [Mesorhizobium japonicum]
MNKIALVTSAILLATGGAFAGSDHYGSDNANQPVTSIAGVDHAATGAVKNTDMAGHKAADTGTKTTTDWPEPGQGIWGN